jgi:hypothetical protein
MVGAQFAAIRCQSYHIDRTGMAAEGIRGNDKGGMPIENTFLLHSLWQGGIAKIHPV